MEPVGKLKDALPTRKSEKRVRAEQALKKTIKVVLPIRFEQSMYQRIKNDASRRHIPVSHMVIMLCQEAYDERSRRNAEMSAIGDE